MRTPSTTGKPANDLASYLYQALYEISIEAMTPDRDMEALDVLANALIGIVESLGDDGTHETNTRLFLTEGMVLEAMLTLRLRPEREGEIP